MFKADVVQGQVFKCSRPKLATLSDFEETERPPASSPPLPSPSAMGPLSPVVVAGAAPDTAAAITETPALTPSLARPSPAATHSGHYVSDVYSVGRDRWFHYNRES